jgi:hypothetical protein
LIRRKFLVEALEQTSLQGFAFDLELLVRLAQNRAVMVDAPVVMDYHMKFGAIGFGTVIRITLDTFETWYRLKIKG